MGDTRARAPGAKKLAKLGPGMLVEEALAPIWKAVDIYSGPEEFLATFRIVHEPQGLLLAARWCETEVKNGGFHQFFRNSTGVLAPESVRGFELLGMKGATALVAKAVAKFGPRYPRDDERRASMLTRLEKAGSSREEWDPFHGLDDAFYELDEISDFDEHADAFVRKNMSMFFR
jgi:hypothetical protein